MWTYSLKEEWILSILWRNVIPGWGRRRLSSRSRVKVLVLDAFGVAVIAKTGVTREIAVTRNATVTTQTTVNAVGDNRRFRGIRGCAGNL